MIRFRSEAFALTTLTDPDLAVTWLSSVSDKLIERGILSRLRRLLGRFESLVGLFASGPTAIIFDFAVFAWWLSEFIGASIIPMIRARGRTSVRRDRGSVLVIVFSIYAALVIVFGFGYSGTAPMPDLAYYVGIPLIFLGIIIRQYAIAVLGRFFSPVVRVAEGHKVVDKGPYRYVRHPSYTGVLITFIGLGLAVQSWAAVVLIVAMFAVAFGYRMSVEEKILSSELGQDYVSYMQRTKRLIPFVI